MRKFSIKNDIVNMSALLTCLCLVALFLVLQKLAMAWLDENFNEGMRNKSNMLMTLTKVYPGGVDFDFADEFMPEFESETHPEYFEIWLSTNNIFKSGDNRLDGDYPEFEKSHSLGHGDLPMITLEEPGLIFGDMTLPDGRPGRYLQQTFYPQVAEEYESAPDQIGEIGLATIVLAADRSSMDQQVFLIRLLGAGFVLIVLSLLFFIIRFSINRGLAPIIRINNQIREYSVSSTGFRLNEDGVPEELETLVKEFNGMIQKIERKAKSEKMFAANVAHELKTPIAEIHSIAEIGKNWPVNLEKSQSYFQEILSTTKELDHRITSLLVLAKIEYCGTKLDKCMVDLTPHLEKIIHDVKIQYMHKRRAVMMDVPSPANINVSNKEFLIVLSNLIENAFEYSDSDHVIRIALDIHSPDDFSLCVTNHVKNLAQDDLNYIADRLWRKDSSRSENEHLGIGLSIARIFLMGMDMELSFDLDINNYFTARIMAGHPAPRQAATRKEQARVLPEKKNVFQQC